jgi:hypothetical protein
MKTTIEIPDPLLEEARQIARATGTTLRSLIEQGLREVIAKQQQASSFRLRDSRFKGRGLKAPFSEDSWSSVRDLVYEGHGA